MDSIGRRNPPTAPGPQLARKCYNVDDGSSDGSDSDNSSLVILSPSRDHTKSFDKIRENPIHLTRDFDLVLETSTADTPNNYCKDAKIPAKKKPPQTTATKIADVVSNKSKVTSDGRGTLNVLPLLDESDTGDDSDDDNFLLRSKRTFGPSKKQHFKENSKQKMKRVREDQKEKEKQDRIRRRKEVKEAKELKKQKDKITKKRQNEEYNQATGKYSHEEIAVLLDAELYTDNSHGLKSRLSEDFFVYRFPSRLPTPAKAIQFIRKDKLLGGAKDAVLCLEAERTGGRSNLDNNPGYEHIEYLVVLFEPDEFIPLLRRDAHDEEDDYPALESWLDTLRTQWQRIWKQNCLEPKIIFLLYDMPDALDKKWLAYRRRTQNVSRNEAPLPTVKELQDAMQWVLVQFQVECILCPTVELLQSTIHKMARGLCEKPYVSQVTELECIKKIKQGFIGSDDPLEKAKDVWLRQLQQIPGLSITKAQHITEHFPTGQSLWQAYQWEHYYQQHEDNTYNADAVCSSLLEDKFSADNKRYKKLSDSVYRVLTSNDPNEMIL